MSEKEETKTSIEEAFEKFWKLLFEAKILTIDNDNDSGNVDDNKRINAAKCEWKKLKTFAEQKFVWIAHPRYKQQLNITLK